jgi:uncharacterized coiled-coil protein SlyX
MPENTSNHNYNRPDKGTQDWGQLLNSNFAALDEDIEIRDTGGPTESPNDYDPADGAKYLDIDSGIVYEGDGSAWTASFAVATYSNEDDTPFLVGPTATVTDGMNEITYSGNVVSGQLTEITAGARGAVISGGGRRFTESGTENKNIVTDHYGTVGGGVDNQAGDDDSDPSSATGATVSGGNGNTASGLGATVGGGGGNTASDTNATVSGGNGNTASAPETTIGGGVVNTANSVWVTVGGGRNNTASGQGATVSGGVFNTASASDATVGGGQNNTAQAEYATIAGGGPSEPENDAEGTKNVVYDNYGTIGGGANNQAGSDDGDEQTTDNAEHATIGGGDSNTASAQVATVAGGGGNTASGRGATVSGGTGHTATKLSSTVGGGQQNTASGGAATVSGGQQNTASDGFATVPGGARGAAEDSSSFVWNDGTPYHDIPNASVSGLSSNTAVDSEPVTGNQTFSVSATGGVRFITGSASNPNVTYIPGDSAGWTTTSSRAVKTNIDPVEPREALNGVKSMDIATWEYEREDGDGAGTTHIGPMAEEFHDAFDVGSSDEHINSINADGVALAAIQGLSTELDETREELSEKDGRIEELETTVESQRDELAEKDERIAELEAESGQKDERIADLEARLAAVEDQLGDGDSQ